jgi:hypothetical protein
VAPAISTRRPWRGCGQTSRASTARWLVDAWALINIRYDADTRDFLVYNDIAVSLRADVVEFTDD